MSTTGRILRGVLAGAALALVLLGVPVLLVVAVGWPLPHTVPAWSDITATFSGATPLDNHVVWKVLAVVIWIAWTQLAVGALVELDSARRGLVAPSLRGFGLGQGTAGYLIGLITLALPAGAASGAPHPNIRDVHLLTATAAYATPAPAPVAAPDHPAGADVVEHVVQPRENLWVIARRYLPPDATHADIAAMVRRIFDTNSGRPQPDGHSLTNGSEISPGWTLTIEGAGQTSPASIGAPAGRHVTVEPGDTLSGIAKTQLGDADAYHLLFDTNRGRHQPDGGALVDENLIRPGWTLQLPAAPHPSAPAPPATPPAAVAPDRAPAPAPPASVPEGPPPAAPPTSTDAPHNDAAGRAAASQPDEPIGAHHQHRVPRPIGLAGGGLATAGVVSLLDRRRRARLRRRAPQQLVPPPPAPLQRAERHLRAGAAPDQALLLDAALRAAAAAGPPPPLRWVECTRDRVVLQLAAPAPAPAGFTADAPERWQTAAPAEELSEIGVAAVVPTPALAPIGTTPDGTDILVDLEAAPITTIRGPPDLITEQLRGIAVALGSAVWSEDAIVTIAGHYHDEVSHLPGIQHAPSLSDGIDRLVAHAEATARALASINETSTIAARSAGTTPDAWAPLIVISPEPPSKSDHGVDALAMGAQQAVALLCPTAETDATITLEPSGILRLRGCPLTIHARRLPPHDEHAIVDLLDEPTEPDAATPDLIEPIAARSTTTTDRSIDTDQLTPPNLAELISELDVIVRVIGEVEAVRLDVDGETSLSPSKQKGLEAIAYLASRDTGVPLDDVQAALWPSGTNSPKTFRNAITSARSALGADRDGLPLLPNPDAGRYDLSDRVATDYELFHELARQADALDDDHLEAVIPLLTDALSLVRGEPYVGVGRSYAWVAQHRGIIVAEVLNAAEELADIHLALGDWRAAEWAARQGLRAFPCDERLYRILMRAAHAAGNVSAVHRAFHELCHVVADPDIGAEPEDTVHPETLTLLEELTAAPPADRASA